MKVAVIGISGNAGSRLATELLARGHQVTGIARSPQSSPSHQWLTLVRGDANDAEGLAALLAGHDAVIHAARFSSVDPDAVIAAVERAEVPRLLLVGGAATLLDGQDRRLLDDPDFPAAYRDEAQGGARFLARLQQTSGLDWTFLSPSAELVIGERTEHFRLGEDHLLVDEQGRSWVSYEDLAVALVDELERPAHSRRRFTVGY
ncbi:NAD(P)-dependent oxidoreductase [Halotalea alkalilenta]|uniref:3-beta hydroxysteroid dehydrogenase n=1 Tax=Halotalea alkalilenta TaxID=376489 RepID=A0A172YD18_9GAMM|nr:NAD(P)-dependent oxidoreductase [Halotalea alkalilenta]ANF57016.1 3-beta hydroxysteroid dehydrogenase [Halotalea alkalilenta]